MLAVAYQYTYMGKTYQVGEFASDIASTEQSLYVKMLKATTINTQVPMWDLMMKNVYSLGAYQVQKANFKLNVKYLNDTTGTEMFYINEGNIAGEPLLRVMNLDRLDANNDFNPDGRFDYIEGFTVTSSGGKVIFPVVEPFGSHLRKKIGNDAIADKYVYQELYTMQLTEAQQVQDKNKFVLQGEYQSTNKNVISLNATNVPRGSVVVTTRGSWRQRPTTTATTLCSPRRRYLTISPTARTARSCRGTISTACSRSATRPMCPVTSRTTSTMPSTTTSTLVVRSCTMARRTLLRRWQ